MASSTLVDLVKIVAGSSGTDPFLLTTPVAAFRGVEALVDGNTYSYSVQQGANYEFGTGLYDEGAGTLTRGVVGSSYGGVAVPFNPNAVVTFVALAVDINATATGDPLFASNNLSDVVNKASARINLGLKIGENVQAWSDILDAVAATPATAFGISLLGAADEPDARLAIGAAAEQTTVTQQVGTTYELTLADANTVIEFDNAAAIAVTIPDDATVAFPIGTWIELHQTNAGAVTVGITTDTLVSRGSVFDTAGQEAVAGLRKVAATKWRLTGDIA